MNSRETAQSIDDAAADWAAKLDRGLSDVERDILEQWLTGDARRVGGLARAQALWHHAELATLPGQPPAMPPATHAPVLTRRRMLAGTIAAAAAGLAFVPILHESRQVLASGIGEVRRIGLEDGSTVTLGALSQIEVAFDAHRRTIEVLAGEVFLNLAQDPLRPFVAIARGLTIRAASTAFGVRLLAGAPIAVLVSQGQVRLEGLPGRGPVVLQANMRLELPQSLSGPEGGPRISTLEPEALERDLAWRDGLLSFEGETLAAATAKFDRYGPVRFEITDPALALETITGVFAASDPKGFARAIAPVMEARAEIDGNLVRLSRAKSAN